MKKWARIDKKIGDVTGDGIANQVILLGQYMDKGQSSAVENLKIEVQNGKSSLVEEILISDVIGYQPTISLFPFRNKKINDIFISIESGGSGGFGYFYIFGYDGTHFKKLFDSAMFNSLFTYAVPYLNQYKVEIINQTLKKKYILDIQDKGQEYLKEIYDKNGQLKKPIAGDVSELNQLFPIDVNHDGIYELLALERVIGLYNADLLGYVETVLYWQNTHFDIFYGEQFFAQLGYEQTDRVL